MKKTILFVEDERWFMQGVIDALEGYNYEVLVTTDATQALEALESNRRIRLVLLDIMIPPGNRISDSTFGRRAGVELVKLVRQDLKLDIPIICLTVVTDKSILSELTGLRTVILTKPTPPSEIVGSIERLI